MENTKTFKIDFDKGQISGNLDEFEALKQAVKLYLSVPRFEHIIYTRNYGHDLNETIGKSREYLMGVCKRYIREALMVDDRIINVDEFELSNLGEDSFLISFKVVSIYGEFVENKEVGNNVK